ncbi:TPA: hypothetical protein HA246_06200 [Candidatus Woesearchaeota archaeon]|nr:hypothetical protein [Candidatus Woesearchaeota archaeon]
MTANQKSRAEIAYRGSMVGWREPQGILDISGAYIRDLPSSLEAIIKKGREEGLITILNKPDDKVLSALGCRYDPEIRLAYKGFLSIDEVVEIALSTAYREVKKYSQRGQYADPKKYNTVNIHFGRRVSLLKMGNSVTSSFLFEFLLRKLGHSTNHFKFHNEELVDPSKSILIFEAKRNIPCSDGKQYHEEAKVAITPICDEKFFSDLAEATNRYAQRHPQGVFSRFSEWYSTDLTHRSRMVVNLAGTVVFLALALGGTYLARNHISAAFQKNPKSNNYAANPAEISLTETKPNEVNSVQANPPPIPVPQDKATTRLLDYARGYFTQLSELSHESQGPFTQQILDDIAAQYHRKHEFKGLSDTGLGLVESRLLLTDQPFQVLDVEILFQGHIGGFVPFYKDYRAKNLGREPTREESAAIDKDLDILIREINLIKSFYAVARARIGSGNDTEKNVDVLFIDRDGYRIVTY